MLTVVTILLKNESTEQARTSIHSAVRWRDHAGAHGVGEARVVCVCADPEFAGSGELKSEFAHDSVTFRNRAFDNSRLIIPHARELFDEAESSIGSKDLVLVLAPGSALVNLDALAKSVAELGTDSRTIFVADRLDRGSLPVAALFDAAIQRARGLLLAARDGWAIDVQRSIFGRTRYVRIDPSGRPIAYDARWLIGALAYEVQNRGQGTLRLQSVDWAQ